MHDDPRSLLFDPAATRRLVLARRPSRRSVVAAVVSDVVWSDVVRLLRWAWAATDDPAVQRAARWRLAGGCADLLRRLPGLSDELGEPWCDAPPRTDETGLSGPARIDRAAGDSPGCCARPSRSSCRGSPPRSTPSGPRP